MATPQQARQELARRELVRRGVTQTVQPDAVVESAPQSTGGGIIDAFTKGATFGIGPILTAGEAALVGRKPGGGLFDIGDFSGDFESRFDEALAAERAQNEAFREESPALTLGAEIGGAIATAPIGLAGAATTGGKVALAAAEGALTGAGFAAGEGRDIQEGALLGTAFGAAGGLAARGIESVAGGIRDFARGSDLLAKSPTAQALRQKTTKLYDQAKRSGVKFGRKAFSDFMDNLDSEILEAGAAPGVTDKTIGVLNFMRQKVGEELDFTELDTLRRVAQGAAGSTEPAERRLGSMIIDSLDGFVDDASASLGGTAKKARRLWGRVRRDELIAEAIEQANNSRSGFDQGIRVELGKILRNNKKIRGFSEAEKKAIKQIVNGTTTSNVLRNVGKLGFSPQQTTSNIIGGGIGLGAGAAAGGLPGAAAVLAGGTGARIASDALQARNAQILGAMTRAGKPQGQISKIAERLLNAGGDEKLFRAIVRSAGVGGANVSR